MRYYQQLVLLAFLMQFVVLCWARTRFIHDSWPIYWNDIEEMNNDESNNNNNNEFFEQATPSSMKSKRLFRPGFRLGGEDRPKKYFGDTTKYQGGRSLQGLWAMPGRR